MQNNSLNLNTHKNPSHLFSRVFFSKSKYEKKLKITFVLKNNSIYGKFNKLNKNTFGKTNKNVLNSSKHTLLRVYFISHQRRIFVFILSRPIISNEAEPVILNHEQIEMNNIPESHKFQP